MDEFLKIAFLAVTSPIWLPFAKAMRQELLDLFAPDGGLFGERPPPRLRDEIEAEFQRRPPKLVHEWIANRRPKSGGPARSPAASPTPAPAPGARAQRSFRR